jgi:hypothetical protein
MQKQTVDDVDLLEKLDTIPAFISVCKLSCAALHCLSNVEMDLT